MAWRFLNRWLEHTGDYEGLAALPFYLAYRAVVRAKVAAIRASQGDAGHRDEAVRYLNLALGFTAPSKAVLILMHGYSGSGKTWLSQRLLEAMGAVRLRSDVERKRLFGLDALADSRVVPGGIYTAEAGRQTFARLRELAERLLGEGFHVIVDATFLTRSSRRPFFELADSLACPVRLVSPQVEPDVLRDRVRLRMSAGGDASEADLDVLELQFRNDEPLDDNERRVAVFVDDDTMKNVFDLITRLRH
jgi:predicted kinase